jgi:hypothetical protein
VQVRTEFAFFGLPLHGAHHYTVNHKSTDIGTFGFCNKFLNNYPTFNPLKASITDSAALSVSASTTPKPCVPSSSFTTTGAPPAA